MFTAMQRKIDEQDKALNASPPPLAVNMMATLDAYPNDGWGALDGANNFTLHQGLINMVQANQFNGHSKADLNSHISSFINVCDTIRIN